MFGTVPFALDALQPLLTPLAPAQAGVTSVLPPVIILVLCLLAGVGTVLLLPSGRDTSVRKIGAAVLLAAALILVALLVRAAAHRGGGGMGIYFWVFSAIALVGAVRVVTHTRPVYSALYFVLTVFASAGLFILLWAEFMAAALILIYAGAILITYVFVIMLAATGTAGEAGTGAGASDSDEKPNAMAVVAEHDAVSRDPLIAAAVGFTLMGVLLFVIFDKAGEVARVPAADRATGVVLEMTGTTQDLGLYLFQNHVLNLELAGLLLTISMVGAIIIARRRVVMREPAAGGREVLTAPMTPVDDNPHSIPVYGTDNPRQKAYPET